MSARLVAAMTMTPTLPSKPSISVSSWFKVCSRSSLPPPTPVPRLRPTASISSTKTMQGAFSLACKAGRGASDAFLELILTLAQSGAKTDRIASRTQLDKCAMPRTSSRRSDSMVFPYSEHTYSYSEH